MGENLIMKQMVFSNTQLLAPLEILMSKISLKYIRIHSHNFEILLTWNDPAMASRFTEI